ncbi:MAG: VWA domain-containing protein [Phycisphaerales bacterium]|nr:VWA domain-containing protein [Phycisphaerales bacterium]
MSELFYRLLGSPALRWGQAGVEFGFERPIPAWGWALIAIAAAGVAAFGYARLQGARPARLALAILRGLLVLLLAVLIAGPRLIKPNEAEEKDWVLVLVDRSASLTIADAGESGTREPREAQLRDILKRAEPTFAALKAQRVLVWLGFDASSYDLTISGGSAATSVLPELGEPRGQRTDISKAIDAAVRRAASRPISGIVLFSDGRSVDETSRALLRRLDAEKIPVFPIALGSSTAVPDLAVRRATAPRSAFLADAVPVEVELSRTAAASGGAGAAARPEPSVVELIDSATGAVLDTREVTWAPAPTPKPDESTTDEPLEQTQRVTLTHRPAGLSAGNTKWTVRVRPPSGAPSDFVDSNNSADVPIELVDRPMRIAYFDGYPRWEYRYLKNLLVREQSASAAIMLLASGKRYVQEGTVILDALPRSPEDWAKYDVVMLGDVWPGVFTQDQLSQLRDRISIGGAGLIWIGGEGSTPGAWRATPLNELLPFVVPENTGISSGLPAFDGAVTIAPTPAADRLGVLRLLDAPTIDSDTGAPSWFPLALSSPQTEWSRLYWVQKIDPAIIKPTAEALAVARPVPGTTGDPSGQPAVLSMRYGAGRVLYVATDEIWRWRYGRGELYPERFWIQLVRLLGRESLARSGRPAIIEATPERGLIQQPIRIQVTLIDQSLVEAAPRSLRVRVSPEGGVPTEAGTFELTLVPEAPASSSPAITPLGQGGRGVPRVFSTTWIPTEPGKYRAIADDPALGVVGAGLDDLTARIEVWQPDDELRRPQADHANLNALAQATGGKLLLPTEIAELPKLLPNRTLKLIGEPDVHTLWDTPLALLLVVLLLTLEWVGRRLLRLA